MTEREVIITGMGLTTPLAIGSEENWLNLKSLKSGIRYHPKNGLPACFQYYGKVGPYPLPEPVPPGLAVQMKFLNRGALLGFSAAAEAIRQAGLETSVISPGRRALYVASGDLTEIGYETLSFGMKEATACYWQEIDFEKLNRETLTKANPFFLLESLSNNLFSYLSAFYEFRGSNTSLASLSPNGSQALELAFRAIREGKADVALAVGYGNWITEVPLFEIEGLGILSKCNSGACSFRPFDESRDGFIPGEGGAALFLEAGDLAARRGARVLGKVMGCGNTIESSSRSGLNVPERVSLRCMRRALDEAGGGIGDLAFIDAHGSATRKGDRSELMSIIALQESEKCAVPVSGMKPYTGHMGAASDLAEIALGLRALKEGCVPATLNFTNAEQEFSQMSISGRHRSSEKHIFLAISYGLGGQSSAVVIEVT